MATLGNTGASALIKSAASISSAISDYNDKIRAMQWDNSAQTDSEYQEYSKYLNSKIEKLNATGTLASISKAATVTSAARSVTHSYISNSIQRTTQAVMDGKASSQEKLDQIRTLYYQAVDTGDNNLAQNLYSQYQTYDKQVQNEAIAASNAAELLASKNAKAVNAGYKSAIDGIENNISDISALIKGGGQALLTAEEKAQSKTAINNLKAFGVDVKSMTGKSVNNGSLVSAALDSLYELNKQASIAMYPTDPDLAETYYNTADAIMNSRSGAGTINVMGTSFTKEMAEQWAQTPALYHTDMDASGNIKMVKSAISGYTYDSSGKVVPIINDKNMSIATEDWSGENGKSAREAAKKELSKLGFTIENSNDNTGEFNVKVTDASNQMIKNYIDKNGMDKANTEFTVKKFGSGYQLYSSYTTNTGERPLLYLSKDAGGQFGLNTGKVNALTGTIDFQYIGQTSNKYNRLSNSLTEFAPDGTSAEAIKKAFANYDQMPKGYTESTVIPDIARRFYGGDTKAASADVYSYRKNIEQTAILAQKQDINNIAVPGTPKITTQKFGPSLTSLAIPKPVVSPIQVTAKAPSNGNVYWIGTDKNVWLKSSKGVQNMGKSIKNNANGFDTLLGSGQAKLIDDPNPGNKNKPKTKVVAAPKYEMPNYGR